MLCSSISARESHFFSVVRDVRKLSKLRPRSHGYVFKSLRFHFIENGMKVLHPHDHFQIVLPVHTIHVTENATNLTLRMSRKLFQCFK